MFEGGLLCQLGIELGSSLFNDGITLGDTDGAPGDGRMEGNCVDGAKEALGISLLKDGITLGDTDGAPGDGRKDGIWVDGAIETLGIALIAELGLSLGASEGTTEGRAVDGWILGSAETDGPITDGVSEGTGPDGLVDDRMTLGDSLGRKLGKLDKDGAEEGAKAIWTSSCCMPVFPSIVRPSDTWTGVVVVSRGNSGASMTNSFTCTRNGNS